MVDHPCNTSYGDRSITYFHTSSPCTIPHNNSATFTWTNPANPSGNYVGSSRCFFNFNQCQLTGDETGSDVQFDITLNGSTIDTQYLSYKQSHNAFPFVDLAQFGGSYKDNPGSINTLVVYNRAPVRDIVSGIGSDNGVNIYRIYKTNL
jgi:hypothetical protein